MNFGIAVNLASGMERAQINYSDDYGVSVINKAESYLFKNGEWIDWTDYIKTQDYQKTLQNYAGNG
ncbi:MAG: hypothetical protein IKF90_03910 [Parasporobacterium sp.]|nr:hypothetical protein [Parasporobacterium sp.]